MGTCALFSSSSSSYREKESDSASKPESVLEFVDIDIDQGRTVAPSSEMGGPRDEEEGSWGSGFGADEVLGGVTADAGWA